MKQTLALLLTAFTLSFAACTKTDNNSNSYIPVSPYVDVAYFKGDMHDDMLTVTSFNGYTVSMIYKGMYFTGTTLNANGSTFNITVTNGHTTATGKIQIPLAFYNGSYYTNYTPTYIQFDPGSIFESHHYTLIN